MATLNAKKIRSMGDKEREKKLKELRTELIKAKAEATKKGNAKIRETKKIIARLLTINKSGKEELKSK